MIGWETDDPGIVGHLVEEREGAAEGHDEREEREEEVMEGGKETEERFGESKRDVGGERVGEREIGEESEG